MNESRFIAASLTGLLLASRGAVSRHGIKGAQQALDSALFCIPRAMRRER